MSEFLADVDAVYTALGRCQIASCDENFGDCNHFIKRV